MRRLKYSLNTAHLRRIKAQIVPTLFTYHQFGLIEKKFQNKKMTSTEKNEFSRTVSRKMKAIHALMEKEDIFVYSKERIRKDRLQQARQYIHRYSRIFRNKHIFITGSFLYQEKYNDIDIFVISKYDKKDYQEGKFHINYLSEDVYGSLFFRSASKLCISNKKMEWHEIKESLNQDTFISLYQELRHDMNIKFPGMKKTLREFLLQAAYFSNLPFPASDELAEQINAILRIKEPSKIIQKIFVQTMILGFQGKRTVEDMKEMVSSYKEVMKEYPKHKEHYLDLIDGFQEVIALAS
ncbi:MAG: hypothetical protein Q7K45_04200 [Nanoarchaeota archaeon]|nr:hypothetical protein [Nanoarchaeota archaeon]